jgi:hypothetical protein
VKRRGATLAVAVGLGLAFMASGTVPGAAALKAETIGIVQPNGEWHLDFPGQDLTLWFGAGNDQPLLGDWDCDDIDTPAVYRSNGRIHLTNDSVTGVASATLFFGAHGDIAVVGDWDNDGCDSFGVYRPSESRFYLSNSLVTGPAEIDFFFGGSGDVPLSGDWDGDGFDTVGVYRSTTAVAYLTNGVVTAEADTTVVFGRPDDVMFTGDWDGDGVDTLGALRATSDSVHLLNSNDDPEETIIPAGGLGGVPVSGLLERVVTVIPVGTALENGEELRRAAAHVAGHHPSSDRPWTIRVEPGSYDLSATIPGLEVPESTSFLGTATAPETVLIYNVGGPAGSAIVAGSSRLEHFTIQANFGFASGIAIEALGNTEINDVAIDIDTTRSATGILVSGFVTIGDSTLNVVSARTAVPIWIEETGDVAITDTDIFTRGSFNPTWGVVNIGTASIDTSSITVVPGAFGTPCAGVVNIGPELTITNTEIDVCTAPLGGPNPPEPGTGVDVEAGTVTITDSTIHASEYSVSGNSLVTVTQTNLGAPVNGPVTCTNTVFGFALFPTECPGQPYLYRVNAGGSTIDPGDGTAHWTADLSIPPSTFVNFDLVVPGNVDAHSIAVFDATIPLTTPVEIFATERWDGVELPEMRWNFPAPYNLTTEVRLYFSSGFDGASLPGDRIFDVLIDGVLVLDDYDIVAEVGHGVATMKSFLVTTDFDGIDIEFRHTGASANNPQINGLEVLLAVAG